MVVLTEETPAPRWHALPPLTGPGRPLGYLCKTLYAFHDLFPSFLVRMSSGLLDLVCPCL